MHYIVSLDYLVKRASLVGSGLLNMLPISALPLQIVVSLNSLYGPKSEKKEATVHINPLLGGFFFRRSSLFFLSRSGENLLAKCCVCRRRKVVGNDATIHLLIQ